MSQYIATILNLFRLNVFVSDTEILNAFRDIRTLINVFNAAVPACQMDDFLKLMQKVKIIQVCKSSYLISNLIKKNIYINFYLYSF